MKTRIDWLDGGLRLLAEGGVPGLRIDALARRMALTKGSFYHHFVDLADFRRALLGHYEEGCTRRQIAANAGMVGLPPLDRLARLAEDVLAEGEAHRGLEVAIRAWASQDDDARQTLERVDALRLDYLGQLTKVALDDATAASELARTIYYVLIGSQHAVPPGTTEELRGLWDRLLGQVAVGVRR